MNSDEIDKICHMLALRNNPSLSQDDKRIWTKYIHYPLHDDLICLICRKVIVSYRDGYYTYNIDYAQEVAAHGLSHLKENNLLPFI